MPSFMSPARLGVPPEPKRRSRKIEYAITFGCAVIVVTLLWRLAGDTLIDMTRPSRSQAVVILSDDECIGGLCAVPAVQVATAK
jgi:hypothetical protein